MNANDTRITPDEARELLAAPSGSRPRIYGMFEGQIVGIKSVYYLERYPTDDLWVSGTTTVSDMIRRA